MQPEAKDKREIEGIVQDAMAQAVDLLKAKSCISASRRSVTLMARQTL